MHELQCRAFVQTCRVSFRETRQSGCRCHRALKPLNLAILDPTSIECHPPLGGAASATPLLADQLGTSSHSHSPPIRNIPPFLINTPTRHSSLSLTCVPCFKQERESYSQSMCRLLERSVFSDRMVFVRSVHKSKFINDTEVGTIVGISRMLIQHGFQGRIFAFNLRYLYLFILSTSLNSLKTLNLTYFICHNCHVTPPQLAIYDSWFNPVINTLPTLIPNGFIYLRAQPETCYRRMQKRARNEETTVQLDYLQVDRI